MIKEIDYFASWYSAAKDQISTTGDMTESMLHVHAGLLIFVVAALLLRQRMGSPIPLGLVVVVAVLNEVVDFAGGASRHALEPLIDVGNTVLWPTVLFLLARRRLVGAGTPLEDASRQ